MMSRAWQALLVGMSIVFLCACDRAQKPETKAARPNVIVVTVDTLRADHLGCYGFEPARTPNIDRLAAEGVRVDRAIAPTPITLPSHASIFTGLQPPTHGVRDNGAYLLPDEVQTLAERLKSEGYKTQAFVSAQVLHRRFNLDQGFDDYDDSLWKEGDRADFSVRERSAARTMDRVLEWLNANEGSSGNTAPFFLWVHLFDPHHPYQPPAVDAELAPTPYDGEIASVDRQLGRFVQALERTGLMKNTIFVFTSDHGESLGEHEEATHAIFIYESTVRVPLIFRYPPKLPAGKVYAQPVRSVDVMPTILSLADQQPNKTQGQDLSGALAGGMPPPSLPQYSESRAPELYGMAPLYGVRVDQWTYIRAPRPELYDRDEDPSETLNLLEVPAEDPNGAIREAVKIEAAKLDARLAKILDDSKDFGFVAQANPLDQKTIEMLQALGYMEDSDTRQDFGGMDPKDAIKLYDEVDRGTQLLENGDNAGAVRVLRALLEQMPRNVVALNTLALGELRLGNPQAAEKHYLKSLAIDPHQYMVLVQLGRLHLEAGNAEAASARFLEALRVVPGAVEATTLMGYLHAGVGRPEEAKRWYQKAINEDPNFPQAYLGYGDLYLREKKYQEAKRWYEKALELWPRSFRASLQVGASALGLGDLKTAERYFVQASEIDPESWQPLYMLASVRAVQGDASSALSYLEEAAAKGFSQPALLQIDKNLASLQSDPRFVQLVQRLGAPITAPTGSGLPRDTADRPRSTDRRSD